MRFLRFVVTLLLVVVLHLVGLRLLPGFAQYVDLFLVMMVLHGLDSEPVPAMVGGTLVGLSHDAVAGSLYGLHGMVGTIIGFGTSLLARQVVIQRSLILGLVFFVATALQEALMGGLLLLLTVEPPIPDPLALVIKSSVSGLLGVLAYRVRAAFRRRRKRPGRRRKVQLQ